MLLMKFGGSSIEDAVGIRRVCRLVRDRLSRDPMVVVSAHGGVTSELLRQARLALQGEQDLTPLQERHAAIARDLGVDVPEHEALFRELGDLLPKGPWTPYFTWLKSSGNFFINMLYALDPALRGSSRQLADQHKREGGKYQAPLLPR